MELLYQDQMTDLEENKYSREYERLHISTLEHKIREKDRLLLELSSINQEIYQQLSEMQQKLSLSKTERDSLLHQTLSLKDQLLEKNTVITQQEALISRLRNQISELTNGHSLIFEERPKSPSPSTFMINELKALQFKYDSREDLIVKLQDERNKLFQEIDRLRGKVGVEPVSQRRSYYNI